MGMCTECCMVTELFTGSWKRSFLIFCRLFWRHTWSGGAWWDINPVSLPSRVAPVFMMRLGLRSDSRVAQVPDLQSPADASNSDAGAERIRISSGVPAGMPLWQCLLPLRLTLMFPVFISLRFLTSGSPVHLMICFSFWTPAPARDWTVKNHFHFVKLYF